MTSVLAFHSGPLSPLRSRGVWSVGLALLGGWLCTTPPAVAQSGNVGDGTYQLGSPGLFGGISLSHDLSLNVPLRLGLYVNRTRSSFPENPDTDCYLAARRNPESGEVTRLNLTGAIAAASYNGDGQAQGNNTYSYPGEFRWGEGALELAKPTTTLPMLCLNRTVLSTYVNKSSGWRLTALYQGVLQQGTEQPLLVALRFPSSSAGLPSFAPDYLASGMARDLLRALGNTTAGWQDGFLMLGMLFEGGLPTRPLTLEGSSLTPTLDAGISLSIADLDQP